jgi:hypothetical protein
MQDRRNSAVSGGVGVALPIYIERAAGGIVVDIKFLDNGVHVLCLNNQRRLIQYKFDGSITFQKLSVDEQLILMAYENL